MNYSGQYSSLSSQYFAGVRGLLFVSPSDSWASWTQSAFTPYKFHEKLSSSRSRIILKTRCSFFSMLLYSFLNSSCYVKCLYCDSTVKQEKYTNIYTQNLQWESLQRWDYSRLLLTLMQHCLNNTFLFYFMKCITTCSAITNKFSGSGLHCKKLQAILYFYLDFRLFITSMTFHHGTSPYSLLLYF